MDLSRVESLNITCSILGVENVNAFIYTYNRLDGMCGRQSIWRRRGRYEEMGK